MNLTNDPRAAGEIVRYHTWSRCRDQSVGEHTWQILRILLTVWADCPRDMLVYTVTHDMGEMAGDIPFPFKQRVPALKEGSATAEGMVLEEMEKAIGLPHLIKLDGFQLQVFKLVEYVEMWEYGLREVNMGNRYARLIVDRMHEKIYLVFAALPATDTARCVQENIKNYIKRRLEQET